MAAESVSQRLGHARAITTLNVYARRLAEPVNRLGDRVFGTEVHDLAPGTGRRRQDIVFWAVAGGAIGFGLWRLLSFVTAVDGWGCL